VQSKISSTVEPSVVILERVAGSRERKSSA
jgi:hypothetical protein